MTPLRTAEAVNHRLTNDITFTKNVEISGNLTVQGTETFLNTEVLNIEDKNIVLGNVETPTDTTANGGGITLKGATDKTIVYDQANNRWASNIGFNATSLSIDNVAVVTETLLNTKEDKVPRLITITSNNYVVGTAGADLLQTTMLLINSGSTINVVLSNVLIGGMAVPVGSQITIIRQGAGRVTVSGASGVTLNSAQGHLAIRDRYASIAAIYLGSSTWLVIGSLEA